jgi:dTDP-4-amino-4,6-dideoxygalactose transaminase
MEIKMVDLKSQYEAIKTEVNKGIKEVIDTTSFIKGETVHAFQKEL